MYTLLRQCYYVGGKGCWRVSWKVLNGATSKGVALETSCVNATVDCQRAMSVSFIFEVLALVFPVAALNVSSVALTVAFMPFPFIVLLG